MQLCTVVRPTFVFRFQNTDSTIKGFVLFSLAPFLIMPQYISDNTNMQLCTYIREQFKIGWYLLPYNSAIALFSSILNGTL